MSGDLSQVASQYAEAVIEIIEESHKGPDAIKALERVHGDLKVIAEIFDSNEDFSLVLNHPNLSPEDKKNLLLKTFEGRVDP
ncbi:MAG TPA: F0F1 ATP synthase subunit delta, partial [Candidatus Melainabacteria bacterium]|nr:F0F1 ATP synthase subunit delta [Candidatus Melainabacteria bacterium]